METIIRWLTEHLYDYMVPLCLLCLFRLLMCTLQTRRTAALRRKLKFLSVRSFFTEIGCWLGILAGGAFTCLLPRLWFLGLPLTAVLGTVGYRQGRKKGIAADAYWREEGKRLIAEAQARGEASPDFEVKTHGAGALIQAITDDHRDHSRQANGADSEHTEYSESNENEEV